MSSDASPPTPFEPPPSVERAVQEHLDVVLELRENKAELSAIRAELHQLRGDVGRAINVATEARLLMGRLAKHLGFSDA